MSDDDIAEASAILEWTLRTLRDAVNDCLAAYGEGMINPRAIDNLPILAARVVAAAAPLSPVSLGPSHLHAHC